MFLKTFLAAGLSSGLDVDEDEACWNDEERAACRFEVLICGVCPCRCCEYGACAAIGDGCGWRCRCNCWISVKLLSTIPSSGWLLCTMTLLLVA